MNDYKFWLVANSTVWVVNVAGAVFAGWIYFG